MRVFILTEGSSRIGFGHITRCLSLYDAFEDIGCEVKLVVNGDSSVGGLFEGRDHQFLDWAEERNKSLKLLDGADVAVIDSYLAARTFYEEVAKTVRVPVHIDDTKRIDYPGGVVVNGSIFAEKMKYPARDDTTCLLGSRYALLRKEFWEVPEGKIKDEPEMVMVTFGGEDAGNLTPSVLKLLKKEFPAIERKVVIGNGYGNREEIEREGKDEKTEFLYNLDAGGMRDVMLSSDIAISACGQTLYELARIGVPTVAVAVAENQMNNARGWREAGFIEYAGRLGEPGLTDAVAGGVRNLLPKPEREERSRQGLVHVDGLGSRRTVSAVALKSGYHRRRPDAMRGDKAFGKVELVNFVNLSDDEKEMVLGWRNSEDIRKWMFSNHLISASEHMNFIERLKNDDSRFYWLFRIDGSPEGVGSFQDVDFTVMTGNLGIYSVKKGAGKLIMKYLLYLWFDVMGMLVLTCELLSNNIKASEFYKLFGFKESGGEKDALRMSLTREDYY